MDLFQSLEAAAGLGGAPSQPAVPQGVLSAILQMVQSQPGGLGGIVERFETAGLGGAVQSWLGSGANHPIGGSQVQSVLGPEIVGKVATQLGVSPGEASSHIAQFLPLILDHLSPQGRLPAGGGGGELASLLAKLGT